MPSNVRQLLDNGVPVYPITDKSLVIGLQDVPFESYVVAWDGASTPVPANIPAGVVVTYNTTDYTGTLAAGSATAPYLYLVASASQQGEYDRYIVTHTGSTYAWTQLGSTAPVSPVIADDLTTNDASKALSAKQGKILGEEVGELEAKVTNLIGIIVEGSSTPYRANTVFMQYPQVKPGDVVYMTIKNTNGAAQAVQFYDTSDNSLGSTYQYGWGGGGVLDDVKSYVITIPNNYGYAKTLWGHGIAILHLGFFTGSLIDEILNSEEHSDFRDDLLDEMKVGNNPGVNLIDPNAPDTRIGYYLKPNNEFVANADYNTTGFVPVVAGSTYYSGARVGQMRFVNYYDSDKNYLSNAEYVNSFTAPVNCAFVRITFYSANWDYVQISKDSQKPYEPYSPIDGYLNTNPKFKQIDKQVNDLMMDITTVPTWVNGNFSVSAGTITYTSYNNRARFNTPMAMAPGESVKVTTIHADADIICAYIQDGVATQLNSNWADLCEFTAEQACTFIVQAKVGDLTSFYNDIALYVKVEKTTLKGAVSKLMSGTAESTDIVSLNDKKRTAIPILSNFAKAYKVDSTTGRKPLVILHFSDIHANAGNLSRISAFLSEYSDYIDGAISTGDVLAVKYDNASIWGDAPEGMLNVIGNHDCQTQDSTDANVVGVSPFSPSWYLVNPTIPYNNLIKPYVDDWGVTQPADAETYGKLYYYKDFSTEKVRLIVVDGNYWDSTQKTWLETVLAGAKTGGLSVLIASHYSAFASTRQPSNPFDSLDADTTIPMNAEVADAVQDFIDADGDFVCYIGGHRHADIFGVGISFPEQLQILVNTASDVAELQNDTARVAGTKSQDLFNIIAIDTYSKLIKVWRVGADYDRYGRFKGTLCWKYDTGTLIKD